MLSRVIEHFNHTIVLSTCRAHVHLVFPFTYQQVSEFTVHLGLFFGLSSPRLTTHTYRRGGASAYFEATGSYDLTQQQGRWAQVKVARSYIDAALADKCQAELPEWGADRVARTQALLAFCLAKVTDLD